MNCSSVSVDIERNIITINNSTTNLSLTHSHSSTNTSIFSRDERKLDIIAMCVGVNRGGPAYADTYIYSQFYSKQGTQRRFFFVVVHSFASMKFIEIVSKVLRHSTLHAS